LKFHTFYTLSKYGQVLHLHLEIFQCLQPHSNLPIISTASSKGYSLCGMSDTVLYTDTMSDTGCTQTQWVILAVHRHNEWHWLNTDTSAPQNNFSLLKPKTYFM
jgi:hypothetical protein